MNFDLIDSFSLEEKKKTEEYRKKKIKKISQKLSDPLKESLNYEKRMLELLKK